MSESEYQDYQKLGCDLNDENLENPCRKCIHFCFPLGCMFGNEDIEDFILDPQSQP
jgi:hypothetical protein